MLWSRASHLNWALTYNGRKMELPKFKYHPDPIATGVFEKSDDICECCSKAKGYIYTSSFYTAQYVKSICPWCIADGSAATKYNGSFSDDYPLIEEGVDLAVVVEVCERTPGYPSWQQEIWQVHCGTACEFHGDAEKEDLECLAGYELDTFLTKEMVDPEVWPKIIQHYEKGGQPSVYKFKCTECQEIVLTMDYT
ncbi:UPF0167 protein [Vibrio scophthalmi]|nr:UPF0167 protein [Vibrio scophthalmi]